MAAHSDPNRSGSPFAPSHLLESDLAVGALLPDVPDVVDGRAITLLVIGDVADDGMERHAGMHDFRDLLRIEGVRLFRRLLDDLDRGVGVERIALWVEPLGPERGDRVLGVRVLARLRAEGHQGAFDARAADRR